MLEIPPQILADFETLCLAALAIVLGGLVGWEREAAGKWAGLRTHMLVCLAAALFVRLEFDLASVWTASFVDDPVRADPNRILQAIVTGIAFLGAGTIFRDRDGSHGLTTAASLLTTGTIGVAVALESYVLAVGITLLILIVLRLVATFERRTRDPES